MNSHFLLLPILLPILCGVATIENGYSHLAELHVLKKEEILDVEKERCPPVV